ncbi:MAG: hypothetical protein U0176_11195 [Bacteroidia bacterium]
MASLSLYNRLVEPRYADMQKTWVRRARQHLDKAKPPPPPNCTDHGCALGRAKGLLWRAEPLPVGHRSAICRGAVFKGLIRFSGQSRVGLATVREYPRGTSGMGDVDSGPVIWGVGFSATIVGIGAYLRMGEVAKAQSLSNAVEALGFSYRWGGRKRYIWGQLPIADAFIAWARAQRADEQVLALRKAGEDGLGSAVLFHLVSVVLVGLLLGWRYRGRLKRDSLNSRNSRNLDV